MSIDTIKEQNGNTIDTISWDTPAQTGRPKKKKINRDTGGGTGFGDGTKPNVSGKKGKSKDPVAGATKMAKKKPKTKPKKPEKTIKMPKPDSKVDTQKVTPVKKKPSEKEKIKQLNALCSKILKNIKVIRLEKVKHPWHEDPITAMGIQIGTTVIVQLPGKNSKPPKKSSGSVILDKLGREQRGIHMHNKLLKNKDMPAYVKFMRIIPMMVRYFHRSALNPNKHNDRIVSPKTTRVTGNQSKMIRNYLLTGQDKIAGLFETIDSVKQQAVDFYYSGDYSEDRTKALEFYFGNWVSAGLNDEDDEADTPMKQQETKTMNQDDIKKLIKEAFTDRVYGKYPYSHQSGEEEEPKEDYAEQWKSFCLELVQDKSASKAIELAKILIKDLELFEDVLDLAGQNQSIGSEILRKVEDSKKDML